MSFKYNEVDEMEAVLMFGLIFSNSCSVDQQAEAIAALLAGELDEGLLAYSRRVDPTRVEFVKQNIERVKNEVTAIILNEFAHPPDLAAEIRKRNTQAVESFKGMHKQSDYGTTAEIAAKLGVSKKQVRKLKQEGKLDEAMQALNA